MEVIAMGFKAVSPKLDPVQMEERMLRHWKMYNIIKKAFEANSDGPEYVFYEGPPTANGQPGVHHVLARSFKDNFPRYRAMRGYHVIRRGGWDTHGLPVEIEVEKKLGFTNKQQIEAYGIDKFNEECRKSAFTYIKEWERLTDRIAFWVDLEKAYVTYTNEYIESVWWILKSFWQKDLLFQGYKVVPYCPRCGTPLSDHEVALGYDDAVDPSVYVRFPLLEKPGTSLLVWTTTPWTLPANVAVAVHPDVEYATIERPLAEGGIERLIIASALIPQVFGEEPVQVVERCNGAALKGLRYAPLFTFIPVDKPAYYIVNADYVTIEDGTGMVHIAPAFGAEDMEVGHKNDLPIIQTVQGDGTFISEVKPWAGVFVKAADPSIMEDLRRRGLLFKHGTITHTYPFCWRCKTPLIYYARPTWYIRTSQYKDRLVQFNDRVNWYPGHIKHGRFGNWLSNNIDWALGRNRYWGTPLPVWECPDCQHQECIGSVQELSDRTGMDQSHLDLHRPHVDNIRFACDECGGKMQRVPELIDVWFDSGSMPYAQWHYPFENQEMFKQQYPADYICEAVDQTRGWFYSLHAISTMLFEQECFKNVMCLGLILDGDGQKMSKSRGNVVDPWSVLNTHGADAFRWYLYTASPPGQERRFSPDLVGEVLRNFTLTLWNTYSFFVTYARLDGWQPDPNIKPDYNDLDKWLLSSLHTLVRDVTQAFDQYDVTGATRPIETFVNNLSTWYLRRSRRRFWKTESDADKQAAYATLYEALVTVAKLLAPSMPFLSDELFLNLVGSLDEPAPLSVHLATWPNYTPEMINEKLNMEMDLVMKLASLGHSARNKANRKVRQPLSEVAYSVSNAEEQKIVMKYAEILADELNVKHVRVLDAAGEAVSFTLNPLPKQLGQKYGKDFPAIRQAILGLPSEVAARQLLAGEGISVVVGEANYTILPDEVEVRASAREGYAVASEGAYLAALVTDLTPDLVREGLAREFVRRVQDERKTLQLEISDRIEIAYKASQGLEEAIQTFKEYILGETLCIRLASITGETSGFSQDEFDNENLAFQVTRNNGEE
jgi:isoleucyl-tRNA synthetase